MNCPSCGAEIPEGKLLCEQCGTEIQMVPDFDPALENSITQTLSDVAEALRDEEYLYHNHSNSQNENDGPDVDETEDHLADEGSDEHLLDRQKNYFVLSIGCVFIALLILLVSFYIFKEYKQSPNYLRRSAESAMNEGAYAEAAALYRRALENGGDFEQISFALCDCYRFIGQDDALLAELNGLIHEPAVSESGILAAYDQLVSYYTVREQYDQLNIILQHSDNETVKEKYTQYMANIPEFNYVAGAYNEIIPLKILANTTGHIYYTFTDNKPTVNSQEFVSPIFLDTGDYTITALFVNSYGVESPLAKASFHVDISVPFAPEVDAYSGEFYTPQLIHAEAEEGCTIYYTTDGSEPTTESTKYNGFLTMPLGRSTFKFVAVDELGSMSEVTVRNYELSIISDFTVKDALFQITSYLKSQGSIISDDGTLSETDPRRLSHVFACCVSIEEEGDFYIFSEYLKNPDGQTSKTGNYYAVGVYSMPLYETRYDSATGTFALVGPQLNP